MADMLHGIIENGKKYDAYFEGEFLGSSYNFRSSEIMFQKREGTFVDGRVKKPVKTLSKVNKIYNIDQRFEFLEKAVEMAGRGVQPSVIISGRGGVGKTYSVTKALKNSGLIDITGKDIEITYNPENYFITFKGFSTAKAFFRTLYTYNGSTIICDDMDSVFKDNNSISILKAALDSYSERIIHWGSEIKGDDDLPRTFEFTGKIVFITNLNTEDIDQAVISRSMVIDLSMTAAELVERMITIVQSAKFLPEYSMDIKMDSLRFIDKNKENIKELSLRSLISVCKIRSEFSNDWEDMAKYITCA